METPLSLGEICHVGVCCIMVKDKVKSSKYEESEHIVKGLSKAL